MQRRVIAAALEQLPMVAYFHDRAVAHHDDTIGALDRRQPMRDHERRAPLHQVRERGLNSALRLGVERRGGFVENQHGRVLEQCARNRDALPLPAREQQAALADARVEAVGKLRREFGT